MSIADAVASFDVWMVKVDEWCYRLAGVSVHDLPDLCFADLFEDGTSPREAARMALSEF